MNKYSIHLTGKAQKDLKKLSPALTKRLLPKIRQLTTDHRPPQYKSLMGKSVAQYRLRVGDYRIIYDIIDSDKVILIFRIAHRKDVYR